MKTIDINPNFVINEVQLSYKRKHKLDFEKIVSSQSASDCIREIFPSEQICYREHMYVLYLDNSNNILGYQLLSVGGITGTLADIRIILQGALLINAVGLILFHNHPSGNLTPSNADILLTQKVEKACKTIDIKLLDHIIITENSYYSFADNGEL